MGHSRRRPITGQTEANVVQPTYIIVEAFERPTSMQFIANGTVTFQVATTLENIMYDATALAAVNLSSASDSSRYVAPADAVWLEAIASGSADAAYIAQDTPIFAIRVDQTAGTGSVTYTILQA